MQRFNLLSFSLVLLESVASSAWVSALMKFQIAEMTILAFRVPFNAASMIGFRLTCFLLFAWLRLATAQDLGSLISVGKEVVNSVEIESLQTSYDQALGVFRAEGEVMIRYGDTLLYSDRAQDHQGTGDIFASGHVTIHKDGKLSRGDEAVYNINTGEISASGLAPE